MLRFVVLALLLANGVYYAWAQGLLASYGFAPVSQSEPQRIGQQIRPEAMRLLDAEQARQTESQGTSRNGGGNNGNASAATPAVADAAGATPAGTPTECLQAGLFNEAQATRLRQRLEALLPVGSWSLQTTTEPGRWLIYMGKYVNEEALAKKRGELRALGQSTEPLTAGWLQPGLSLGHYPSQAEAERELAKAATRGVRTARVMMERPEATGQVLRLPAVDAALKPRLADFRPQLEGKTLQACR